ncbi:MAG: exo-alpha-sialidase [Eubacterium sp.]|nr:exo-alpha-sialidase [Eubacterium sp.]
MGKIIFSESDYRFSGTALAANGSTALAVAVKCSADIDDGAKWGYSELVAKTSTNGGEDWSDAVTIAAPPARCVTAAKDNAKTSFFLNPVLSTAANGDFVLVFTFYPESKGADDKKLLDKKKVPFTFFGGKNCLIVYDRDGKFYTVTEDGKVLDSSKTPTQYTVKGIGDLYNGDEFLGNIYLNGAMGKSEDKEVTASFGAPLKAAKRSYLMAMTSPDGVNWSEPVNITPAVLAADDGLTMATDAGRGVVCDSGRIIVPVITDKGAACIYSDDNGATWSRNQRAPYMPVKKPVTVVQAPSGELIALGKKSSISHDKGISWITYKSKMTPFMALAMANRIYTIINSKAGTAQVGGEFEYNKKGKLKGIAYSKEKSELAGGLLPYTTLADIGGKPAALYITPDNKQVSFAVL